MDRLKELRDKFDRLTRAAQEHGYSNDLKRKLETLAYEIRQEEVAQRFLYGQEFRDEEKKRTKPVQGLV